MFTCELCHYNTDRSANLKKHFETKKHILNAHYDSVKNNTCEITKAYQESEKLKTLKTKNQIENVTTNTEKNEEDINDVLINCHEVDTCIDTCENYNQLENIECNDNNCQNFNKIIDDTKEKRFICENCNKSYSSPNNLSKHKSYSICGVILKKKKKEIEENNVVVHELKKQIENLSNQMLVLTATNQSNDMSTTINTNSNNHVTNNMNDNKTIVFNYVNETYKNAPVLKMLRDNETTEILKINHEKYDMTDFIIFHYKKHLLPAFLGDIIIKAYQKEDPNEQQFWVSCVINLTFIVRQILNKRLEWKKDMDGTVIIKNIINPILKKVLSMLQEYTLIVNEKNKELLIMYEIEELNNNAMIALKIIIDINNKVLHKQILQHIAPKFQLNCETLTITDKEKKHIKKKAQMKCK